LFLKGYSLSETKIQKLFGFYTCKEKNINVERKAQKKGLKIVFNSSPIYIHFHPKKATLLNFCFDFRATPQLVLNTTTLLLDNNNLSRLDNIHTYQCLEKVSSL